jgi:subtilisin-like proprotein convertase family protein
MVGTWTLNVLDYVGKYTGRLNYWNMKFYTHSTVINVTTTTLASAASNCTCKGSRKCTGYTNTLDCTPSNGACYWNC